MADTGVHRPRNLDWKRAASLLYGDWGTSKAYVIGFVFSTGFAVAHFQALPIILAVCALTALVAYNYVIVCKHFPDGGGVYSAAREQSRFLAMMGALLLVANFTVTAAMSGWAAMSYFRVPDKWIPLATIGLLLFVAMINYFGPKHSGSMALSLAVPMVIAVLLIIWWSLPHLTLANLEIPHSGFGQSWLAFTGLILALSGVEAVANLTGVMKLDAKTTMEQPSVARTACRRLARGHRSYSWHRFPRLGDAFSSERDGADSGKTLGRHVERARPILRERRHCSELWKNLWRDCRNCRRTAFAQRGQYGNGRVDRFDLHVGARRRDAEKILRA